MGNCLIIKAECPKNGDPDKGDFCPHWWTVEHVEDEQKQTKVERKMCALSGGYPILLQDIGINVARNTDGTDALRKDLYQQYNATVDTFNAHQKSWVEAFKQSAVQAVAALGVVHSKHKKQRLLGWFKNGS